MRPPRLALEIFLVALATILLEVSYTRVFSYKLVYFFTYVVIGLALLGLGSGGVVVALARPLRGIGTSRLLAWLALAGAVAVALGYLVVATVQVNAFDMVRAGGTDPALVLREASKLALISGALFAPFLCAGVAIATIFADDPARIDRLYFADLLGAGLGCAASVWLMVALSPPGAVILAGACFALAGIRVARAEARGLVLPLVVLAATLLAGAVAGQGRLPDPVVDRTKTTRPEAHRAVLFSAWSPVFRVDVMEAPFAAHLGHVLAHDGMWGSILPHYDGDPSALAQYDTDPRALPFAVLPPHSTVTIIGAAGGNEILASLRFDAGHVTAVELNPVTVSLLTTHFRDYTGRVAEDPRVRLVNAEGRAFFEGTAERSDLVWFVAPDSYAAMNAATSGAYVLSESYLYTVEMLETALAHLTPGGIVCAQFGEMDYVRKPNRTTRYLTTAREAFRRVGMEDFGRHVLVATSPGFAFTTATILLRPEPFTEEDAQAFTRWVTATKSELRFPGAATASAHPVTNAITLAPDALRDWYRGYPYDVRPITDDAPFFWHFVPFRATLSAAIGRSGGATEEGLGERLLLALLVFVTLFAGIALLTPLLLRRALWRTIPHKTAAGLYFAALGLGFMFLEVTLIQRLTLFLGYPTYSLTVTLFALLVSTGVGSLLGGGAIAARQRTVALAGVAMVAMVAFYLLGLGPLTARLGTAPFAARVAVAALVLAPLGLCLGVFMPLGLRSVAVLTPHAEEYVAWAWAVNGFFSVVASVLATLLSMTFGFRAVMLLALAIYGVAILALRRIPVRAQG